MFSDFNVIAALPHNLFAGMVAVPCPPPQGSTALGAKQHACQGITVLIFVFGFFAVSFGLGPQSYLSLCFLPDFAGDDGLMAILKIKAVDFAMIDALLFAEMVLAESFLQLGIPFVFLVLEDAENSAGLPSAAGNGSDPFGAQFLRDDKASLAADIVVKNPLDHFCLAGIDHKFTAFVFVIAEEPCGVDGNFSLLEFAPVSPLDIFTHTFAFFLGKSRKDGQHQLTVPATTGYLLFFEEYLNIQFFHFPHSFQHNRGVSGKTGDGLCQDQIEFACACRLQHPLKLLPLVFGAGDALISKNADILMLRIGFNQVAVMGGLVFQ